MELRVRHVPLFNLSLSSRACARVHALALVRLLLATSNPRSPNVSPVVGADGFPASSLRRAAFRILVGSRFIAGLPGPIASRR